MKHSIDKVMEFEILESRVVSEPLEVSRMDSISIQISSDGPMSGLVEMSNNKTEWMVIEDSTFGGNKDAGHMWMKSDIAVKFMRLNFAPLKKAYKAKAHIVARG